MHLILVLRSTESGEISMNTKRQVIYGRVDFQSNTTNEFPLLIPHFDNYHSLVIPHHRITTSFETVAIPDWVSLSSPQIFQPIFQFHLHLPERFHKMDHLLQIRGRKLNRYVIHTGHQLTVKSQLHYILRCTSSIVKYTSGDGHVYVTTRVTLLVNETTD